MNIPKKEILFLMKAQSKRNRHIRVQSKEGAIGGTTEIPTKYN